jgi:hypothetical protein
VTGHLALEVLKGKEEKTEGKIPYHARACHGLGMGEKEGER